MHFSGAKTAGMTRCQQSAHTLLGYFLSDRDSPTPFPGRDILIDQHLFQWGIAPPLEKVISSGRELDVLMGLPEIYRNSVAVSPVSWLLCLPYALEILSQTKVDESTWTEVSTTCIYYKDWETHGIRRSFTCQFHPELMADIQDIGGRDAPRYAELKDNDGVRMLVRLLYHGMQE
jgi:hypothetical protein